MTHVTPSVEQDAILKAAVSQDVDLLINAVAGAGKTFMLTELVHLLRARYADIAVVAFNTPIAAEIGGKLKGTGAVVSTIHSAGRTTLQRTIPHMKLSNGKYRGLAERWVRDQLRQRGNAKVDRGALNALVNDLVELTNFTRLTLTNWIDATALDGLNQHYRVTSEDWLYPGVAWLIDVGARHAIERHEIDYTDMIWLPYQWDARPYQYDLVLIDECQDLCNLQRAFVSRLRRTGGRIVWAGDQDQCITGYAGANVDSFDRIRETGAVEFHIATTRRCPISHVSLARRVVPRIQARPDAVEGRVLTIREAEIADYARPGDLILCRRTAPLIQTAIVLSRSGLPARVLGHAEGGGGIVDLARQIARFPEVRLENFAERIEGHGRSDAARLLRRHADRQAEASQDRHEALLALVKSMTAKDLPDLLEQVTNAFSAKGEVVTLSTVHRAKGLEAKNVFILKPKMLPLLYPDMQAWERKQERNIEYVAMTRASEVLYYVTEPPGTAAIGYDDSHAPRHAGRKRQRTRYMPGQ